MDRKVKFSLPFLFSFKFVLKSEKGAMDRILVTLLLVIIGIVGLIAIESWFSQQKETLKDESNTKIISITNT